MESLMGPLVVVPILISVATFVIGLAVFTWLTPRFAEGLWTYRGNLGSRQRIWSRCASGWQFWGVISTTRGW